MDDQVTLTAYADQIRELIHHDRNDEAITLCRHILQFYPKCIDTVRQMAEACLEKHELDAAQDLFRRVLSADPENAVAYIGLASIFEERQLTDEAVWHMERAFELSPAHPEIHKELLRLQTVNSRKARARLKLTPGALARLYAYQGLLAQATQELRAIVAGDPTRLDTRTALAEMLWRTGRIHEAAQVAQDLLGPLPYCLKANLILGTAWKESGLPESEAYLQRAQQLDPSNHVAANLLGARSPLLPSEPTVPRYVAGAPVSAPAAMTTMTPAPFTITEPEEPAPSIPEPQVESIFEELPAETPVIETPTETELDVELGPTARPELPITTLPPWLRGETTAEDASEMPSVKPDVSEEEAGLPHWINQPSETVGREPEEILGPAWRDTLEPPTESATTGTMDWLTSLRHKQIQQESTAEETESLAIPDQVETPSQEIPAEPETPAIFADESREEKPAESEAIPTELELPAIFAEESREEKLVEPAQATPTEYELPAIFAEESREEKPVASAQATPTELELPAIFAEELREEKPVEPAQATPTEFELPAIFADESREEKPVEPAQATPTEYELPAIFADESREEKPVEPAQATPTEYEFPAIFADESREEKPAESEAIPTELELPAIFAEESREEKPVEPAEATQAEFELPAIFAAQPTEEKPVEPAEATPIEYELPEIFAVEPREEKPVEPVQALPEMAPVTPAPVIVQPKVRAQPKGYSHLILAREHRDSSHWNDALVEYDWVVQHAPRFVNEVIVDVEALVRRAGVPLDAHRVLGDAYTRAGRLSDALERYRFLRERLEGTES